MVLGYVRLLLTKHPTRKSDINALIPSDLLTGGESCMDTKSPPYTPIRARSSSSAMSAKTSALYNIGQMARMPTVW